MTTALALGGETTRNQGEEAKIGSAGGDEKERTCQQLLFRFCDYVWHVVERLGRKRGWHADDIAEAQSDIIFALIRAAERFDPNRTGHNGLPCSFQTFLARLVRDRFKDFAKKRGRYVRRFSVSLDSGHAAEHQSHCACRRCRQVAAAVVSNEPNPAEVAEQNERAVRLHEAIAKLKPIYRRVAELDLAELSIQEIAAELQIELECAKKRRTKARAELWRLLTEGETAVMTGEQ